MRFFLFALLVFSMSVMPSLAKETTVTQTDYKGWTVAYRLSNGVAEATLVPKIGRVMAFHLISEPETDPLWNNPAWDGKPAPAYPGEWANYGGDKLWPSEQAQWATHQPVAWPPDPSLDNGPYTATVIKNGVRLTGPVSPYFAFSIVREITLSPGAARLEFRDTFIKAKDAAGKKAGFPIGIWSITQTRGDGTVYLPLNTRSKFKGIGYTSLGDPTPTPPSNWSTDDGLLTVTRNLTDATKVGADISAGWMASLYARDVLFSEHFSGYDLKANYPDKGTNAQVYTNGGETAYIEMEALGPMVALKPGQKLTRSLFWQLQHLPHAPTSSAEARQLVKAAMKAN